MLSAVIVGGALTVALTSASFELDSGAKAQPAGTSIAVLALAPAPSPTPPPGAERPPPKVVYYIVNSAEEAMALYVARRTDAVYFAEQGLPALPPTSVYYLLYETAEEERETQKLLNELAILAPYHGIDFNVVDLRQ